MPNDWNIDIAGQQGQPGTQGLAGGTFADAPSDNNVYGRMNATWAQSVNKAGDTMTGALWAPQLEAGSIGINAYWNGSNWIYKANGGAGLIGMSGAQTVIYCAPSGTAGNVCTFGYYMLVDSSGTITNNGNLNTNNISGNAINCNTVNANGVTSGSIVSSNVLQGNGVYIDTGSWGWRYQYRSPYNNAIGFDFSPNPLLGGIVDNAYIYALASASDERLKQDIEPTKVDCLKEVGKIGLFQYRWMDCREPGRPRRRESTEETLRPIGLVAQRLPRYLAREGDDNSKAPFGPGNPMTAWQIDDSALFALLVGAIQQLEKRIAALEEK